MSRDAGCEMRWCKEPGIKSLGYEDKRYDTVSAHHVKLPACRHVTHTFFYLFSLI